MSNVRMYFEIGIWYELLLCIATDPLFFITVLYLLLLIILPGLRYCQTEYLDIRENLCILFMNSSFFATELYINRLYKIMSCTLWSDVDMAYVLNGQIQRKDFVCQTPIPGYLQWHQNLSSQESLRCRWTLVLVTYKEAGSTSSPIWYILLSR